MLFLDSGFGARVRGAWGVGSGLRRVEAETALLGGPAAAAGGLQGERALPAAGLCTAWTPEGRRPHVRRRDRGHSLQVSRRPGWSHRPAHGSGGAADPQPPGTSSRPRQSRTGLELGPRQRPEPPGPSHLHRGSQSGSWQKSGLDRLSCKHTPACTSFSERQLSSPDGTTSEPPDALCPCPHSRAATAGFLQPHSGRRSLG